MFALLASFAVLSLENEFPLEMDERNTQHVEQETAKQPAINARILATKAIPWEYIIGIFSFAMLILVSRQQSEVYIDTESDRRRKKEQAASRALSLLTDLKKKNIPNKALYDILTTIIRNYIEEYYSIPATKKTTEEIGSQFETLEKFLTDADSVKFAQHSPTEQECENAQKTAEGFICHKSSHSFKG